MQTKQNKTNHFNHTQLLDWHIFPFIIFFTASLFDPTPTNLSPSNNSILDGLKRPHIPFIGNLVVNPGVDSPEILLAAF